jgi:hypothetical protein
VRLLKLNLKSANKSRTKMRGWEEWDDRAAESIHRQQWRDNAARIASLTSQLLDAEIALALFDQDHT